MVNIKTIKFFNKHITVNKFNINGFSIGVYANLFYIQLFKYMLKIE